VTEDRPLVLLDVDGVVRVSGSAAERRRRCLHEGWRDSEIWPSFDSWPRVFYNPAIGPLIRNLARETGAELAWASMWEEWANWSIGPLFGLPALPYAPAAAGRYSTGLKADTVVPWTAGRPFVLFEDEPEEISGYMELTKGSSQACLLMLIDEYEGLTAAHLNLARSWLLGRSRPLPGQVDG
jgi:hypothetical protein